MSVKIVYSKHGPRRNLSIPVLLGVSDLARLLGRTPATVTNWRARYDSFPVSRSAGTQPQFDLIEVLQWLEHRSNSRSSGSTSGDRKAPISALRWWELLVRAFSAALPGAPTRRLTASLVLLRHLDIGWVELSLGMRAVTDAREVHRLLRASARAAEAARAETRGLFQDVLAAEGHVALYLADLVDILDRQHEPLEEVLRVALEVDPEGRPRSPRTTGRALSQVMAAFAAAPSGASVFDPACGEGSLLADCASFARGPVHLYGQDLDPDARHIAAVRLLVADQDISGLAPGGHDSMRDDQHPGLDADVVVLDPPLGTEVPPLGEWIRHGLDHLAPTGRLVVAVPLGSLVLDKSTRRAPDERVVDAITRFVEEGHVVGVLVLPRGQRTDVSGPIVVMALAGRDAPRRDHVPVIGIGLGQREPVETSLSPVLTTLRDGGVEALMSPNRDPAYVLGPLRLERIGVEGSRRLLTVLRGFVSLEADVRRSRSKGVPGDEPKEFRKPVRGAPAPPRSRRPSHQDLLATETTADEANLSSRVTGHDDLAEVSAYDQARYSEMERMAQIHSAAFRAVGAPPADVDPVVESRRVQEELRRTSHETTHVDYRLLARSARELLARIEQLRGVMGEDVYRELEIECLRLKRDLPPDHT